MLTCVILSILIVAVLYFLKQQAGLTGNFNSENYVSDSLYGNFQRIPEGIQELAKGQGISGI